MKKILTVLIVALCAFSVFAYSQSMIEVSVSPSSVEYIDFPNAEIAAGADVPVYSEKGIGLGVDWAMKNNMMIFGAGIDADLFVLPTYTDYGQYRLDATILGKAGVCFGSDIEMSVLAVGGAKLIISDNFWFSYAVGLEAKILMPISESFWVGYKVLVDFTNFTAENKKYDSNIFSCAGNVVFSWRLN
jgi:hypothetical protein